MWNSVEVFVIIFSSHRVTMCHPLSNCETVSGTNLLSSVSSGYYMILASSGLGPVSHPVSILHPGTTGLSNEGTYFRMEIGPGAPTP